MRPSRGALRRQDRLGGLAVVGQALVRDVAERVHVGVAVAVAGHPHEVEAEAQAAGADVDVVPLAHEVDRGVRVVGAGDLVDRDLAGVGPALDVLDRRDGSGAAHGGCCGAHGRGGMFGALGHSVRVTARIPRPSDGFGSIRDRVGFTERRPPRLGGRDAPWPRSPQWRARSDSDRSAAADARHRSGRPSRRLAASDQDEDCGRAHGRL